MSDVAVLDPSFLAAIAAVPAQAWSTWFCDRTHPIDDPVLPQRTLVAALPLPGALGHAALCVLETTAGAGAGTLHQAAIRRWPDAAPAGAQVLHQEPGPDGAPRWTLATAWADADLRAWLREALVAGASIRNEGWQWLAAPERAAAARLAQTNAPNASIVGGRRHDVVLFEPGSAAIVYRRMTRGAQPELDVLRHLERVPGVRIAPNLLGSAIIMSPTGQKTASAFMEDIAHDSATVRAVLVARLHRALDGDPSLQAVALEDVRSVGVAARELHAALGRPFEHGLLAGAVAGTSRDVGSWVARAWRSLTNAAAAVAASPSSDPALASALEGLPGKLQQFGAAAEDAPGLVHRIHGSLRLDTVLMSPPRLLRIVEFDGDAFLPDSERLAPQSPLRDVARLMVSIAEAAAEAARRAGGDEKAFGIAWLWEREARKACLEGYGTGGGNLHALLAIFELEYASQLLLDALWNHGAPVDVPSHILQRLSRTIV